MKQHGIRFLILYALASQLQKQADFLFQLLDKMEATAGPEVIAMHRDTVQKRDTSSEVAEDAPPLHWMARKDAHAIPAHWLSKVQQGAPQLLAKKEAPVRVNTPSSALSPDGQIAAHPPMQMQRTEEAIESSVIPELSIFPAPETTEGDMSGGEVSQQENEPVHIAARQSGLDSSSARSVARRSRHSPSDPTPESWPHPVSLNVPAKKAKSFKESGQTLEAQRDLSGSEAPFSAASTDLFKEPGTRPGADERRVLQSPVEDLRPPANAEPLFPQEPGPALELQRGFTEKRAPRPAAPIAPFKEREEWLYSEERQFVRTTVEELRPLANSGPFSPQEMRPLANTQSPFPQEVQQLPWPQLGEMGMVEVYQYDNEQKKSVSLPVDSSWPALSIIEPATRQEPEMFWQTWKHQQCLDEEQRGNRWNA